MIYEYHSAKRQFKDCRVKDGMLKIGMELEVEFNSSTSPYEMAKSIDGYSLNNSMFIVEEDGSLNNGFEIVTAPFLYSPNYTRELDYYKNVYEILIDKNCFDMKNAGFHIHISKCFMSKGTFGLLIGLLQSDINFLLEFSERKNIEGLLNYAPPYQSNELDSIINGNKELYRKYYSLRETANTYEIRIFAGIEKWERVEFILKSLYNLIDFIKKNKELIKSTKLYMFNLRNIILGSGEIIKSYQIEQGSYILDKLDYKLYKVIECNKSSVLIEYNNKVKKISRLNKKFILDQHFIDGYIQLLNIMSKFNLKYADDTKNEATLNILYDRDSKKYYIKIYRVTFLISGGLILDDKITLNVMDINEYLEIIGDMIIGVINNFGVEVFKMVLRRGE